LYKKIIIILLYSTYLFSAESFNQIKFKGLTQISKAIAIETLNFKNKNSYEIEEIDKSIKVFFNFGYFSNIWVTNQNDILTYHFKEKPFIAKLEMTGYKNRKDELKLLYSSMEIKKGMMFTQKKIKKAKTILLLNLEAEGYINSTVETDVEVLSDTSVKVKFEVNKGNEIIITKIKYNGAKNLTIDDFEDVIANKETDCCFTWFFGRNDGEINFEALKYDSLRIKELYLQHGYLDAKVSAAFSKIDFNTNTAQIEYTIQEGVQYKVNDIMIYVNTDIINTKTIYPELKLEKGDVFNVKKLRKDQTYIKTQVANKGYAYTTVNYNLKKNKKNKTVDLVFNVIEGKKVFIADVIISGNSRTLDRVIRRSIYLAPKDLFSLTDYKDSINALRRTGFFSKVEIKQEKVSDTLMRLSVLVEETATGSLIIGGGYGSYDGWMFNASINDKNIFGSGLDLGIKMDYSKRTQSYNLTLRNPSINDSKYSGSINVHQTKSLIVNSETNSTLGDKTTLTNGFSVGVGRGLNRYTRVGTTYSYDDESVEYEKDKISNSEYIISSITPYISFNNTDEYMTPRSGIITGTSLKYAGVGGDAKYILSSTYFKYFYSLEDLTDKDIIIRYKNRIKILEDQGNIPNGTTFYLGGTSSVRGYASYAFQPEKDHIFANYLTNTIELSFPLIPSAKMRWELFYDRGMVGEDTFNQIERSGAGLAISWMSPVGPLQFIFARALDAKPEDKTSNFEFALGSRF